MEKLTSTRDRLFSRRSFVRFTGALMAALGGETLPAQQAGQRSAEGEDYYAKLGVPTIINAAGTYTTLTAACMPPEVLAAVHRAGLNPVRLHDLQTKAGEYIAKRLRCEGAVVTSGASGAISLATAACMQRANAIDPLDMPQNIEGKKNQVIVQRAHRYGYDHAMFLCGARVTEVVTLDEYKRACESGNAVMTNFFNSTIDVLAGELFHASTSIVESSSLAQYTYFPLGFHARCRGPLPARADQNGESAGESFEVAGSI